MLRLRFGWFIVIRLLKLLRRIVLASRFAVVVVGLIAVGVVAKLLLGFLAALPFHAPVLEPNFHLLTNIFQSFTVRQLDMEDRLRMYLRLGEHERGGHFESLGP